MISKPTVNLAAAGKGGFLAGFDETHAHARGLAGDLAGQPLGAGPGAETRVIVGGRFAGSITMRAPAVAIFGSRQFRAAAQLRAAGKSTRIVRSLAISHRGEDVAAAKLVAEKMRRRRHDRRIRGLFRHPVDAGEMKAADAAGLVAAGTSHVVRRRSKAASGADILQSYAIGGGLLQCGDDVALGKSLLGALTLHQAEFRLQG